MTDKNIPTIIIGLDGAHWKLLDKFIHDGAMPTFQRMKDEGSWGILRSCIPPLSAPAWASFATGMTPGKHGVFDWTVLSKGGFQRTPMNSTTIKGERFWQTLSRRDVSVGVVNVPLSYPPYPVKGFLITDWLTPSDDVDFTYPRELKNEMTRETGGYNIGVRSWEKYASQGLGALIDDIIEVHRNRIKNLLYLYEQKRPDLMCGVFTGTDLLQHTFTHVLDSSHPLYSKELEEMYRPRIGEYMSMIDDLVTKMREMTGDKARWLFLSDHGLSSLYKKVYVNRYLEDAGLLSFAHVRKGFLDVAVPLAKKIGLTRDLMQKVLGGKNDDIKSSNLLDRMNRQTGAVDWAKTRVFAMSTDGVYVNIKSRFPFGIVEDGEDYQRAREEAKAALLKLRDPDNDRQVIDKVIFKEEIYSGQELPNAPDLFLEVTDGPYQLSHTFEPKSSGIFEVQDWQTGRHHKDGMIMMWGDSVEAGKITGSIWDVAPTILHWMGFPIPNAMDGTPIRNAFTREFQNSHQVETCPSVEAQAQEFQWSDDEKEELEKRLEGLGYLG